ncbi:MAG: hypothetical protein ACTSVZ_06545 [Promethearchaeota archaeon]
MEYLNLCEDLDDGPLVIHSLNDLDEYLEISPSTYNIVQFISPKH